MARKSTTSKAAPRAKKPAKTRGRQAAPAALAGKTPPAGPSPAHDELVRALKQFSAHRIEESFATLTGAAERFPEDPAVQENLGVLLIRMGKFDDAITALEQALALGSGSHNVHDALCSALGKKGDLKAALHHGRLALEGKDRQFGARPPLCALPKGKPPPFNPKVRAENVIAYSLWGTSPRYHAPLRETLKVCSHLFPGWTIRIYHDASLPAESLLPFRQAGADLRPVTPRPGEPEYRRLLWRFDVCSDPKVKRFLVRDADSMLSVKERVAVDAWLASGKHFHAMRDFFTHTDLLLAGMWGGVSGILPRTAEMLKDFKPFRLEGTHIDQDLLTDRVWPTVRGSCLIHDSVFTGCLGSEPFPPYGALPPGHHIGQNAFIHFRQSGKRPVQKT